MALMPPQHTRAASQSVTWLTLNTRTYLTALPALIALESSAVHKSMESPFAARATKAFGPADLGQRFLTLALRSVKLQELGQGEPLLELNGVAPHDCHGICALL